MRATVRKQKNVWPASTPMIEELRETKQRELVRWGLRLWRRVEARQQIVALEAEPERIH